MTNIKLPPPDNLQPLEFEQLLSDLKADTLANLPNEQSTIDLESDPINELLQAFAYRIVVERNSANGQAQSIMLATARGPQLDQLGELPFFDTQRQVLVAADPLTFPPTEEVLEADNDYRERLRLSLHGLSVAGPANAYRFHALTAHPDVLDVSVDQPRFERDETAYAGLPANAFVLIPIYSAELTDPSPNDVAVTIMTRADDEAENNLILNAVSEALSGEDVRPISDNPRVRLVSLINVDINATLYLYGGNDQDQVLADAEANLNSRLSSLQRIGNDLTLSAIHSGLHIDGVQRVDIASPVDNVVVAPHQSFTVTINLTYGGVDQ